MCSGPANAFHRSGSRIAFALSLAALAVALPINVALADEGGISFWLPGQFGSLAATPQQPGWSFGSIYVHDSVSAGGEVAAARQATAGRFPPNTVIDLNANLKGRIDLMFLNGTYVFPTPVLGGQFAFGIGAGVGRPSTSIDGTLTVLTAGGLFGTRTGSTSDERTGFADLYPMASLRWNFGVHNVMTYVTGDIPVGLYSPDRLANLGIGHGAIDGGVGYTYFNPATGHEFSAVTGLTYNFRNEHTDYQNGIDWHLDWGLSKFLTKQWQVGAVGYFYHQLTADKGAPAFLGDNISRVMAVGPQIAYLFPFGDLQGYLSLKGYYEFDASRRADGWSTWLTFAVSPTAQEARQPSHIVRK